jgi:Protein of unknown function (DUF4242)
MIFWLVLCSAAGSALSRLSRVQQGGGCRREVPPAFFFSLHFARGNLKLAKDLEVQGKYGVQYLHYWLNEAEGTVFCLCQAPSKEAAEAVHREAHGGVADEIIEVKEGK